jgi:uncharacterized protein (DUF697 family)/uncharacterized tellurite resistance protein B-like protein
MSITQDEAVASLRLLVAVAKADGTIHADEKKSLAAALEAFELPPGLTVDKLLGENVDVGDQIALLSSAEAKTQAWRSAYFMAHADGTCSPEEEAVCDRIASAAGVPEDEKKKIQRLFVPTPSLPPKDGGLVKIEDPEERKKKVRSLILKYGGITAALGAFPIPGLAIATDLGVIAIQIKMIRDIGAYWGHKVDRNAAKSMLYGLGLGTGARLAVNNLAKLLPVWGSAIGAASSFASTYALGKVIEKFFAADDAKADIGALASDFKDAEREGKKAYASEKDALGASTKDALAKLTDELKDGKITQAEFDQRLAEL